MDYRNIGRSGLKVSAVGLGCNNFGAVLDEAKTASVVHKAMDMGITLFDTADIYGGAGKSEEFLGKALGARRKEIIVATKFGMAMGEGLNGRGGASRDYIMRAAEASLRRLGTDYIDLYQVHLPDPITPIEETARALEDVVRQGKVRYLGHSNFSGWQTADAAWTARVHGLSPFVSAQNHYSVLSRGIEAELVPACAAHGVSILPFFPLESGLLTGKYKGGARPADGTRWATWERTRGAAAVARFFSEEKLQQAAALEAVAAAGSATILDLAFGWLLSRPYIASVIAGATTPTQVEANVRASEWRPDKGAEAKIDEISPPPK